MGLLLTRDPQEFAALAEDFLAARMERNVLATVLHTVRFRGGFGGGEPLFAAYTDETTGATTAVALRTPPRALLATGLGTASAAHRLMTAWLEHDPEPPSVSGDPATARALAGAYTELTGGSCELQHDEAMHALTEVTPPARPALGTLRAASEADIDTLVRWEREFAAEAGIGGDPGYAEAIVRRRLEAGLQNVWVAPDGAPVATVGHNPTIAGVARIGPVYTPPPHRGRGYATSAVAAVSRLLLDAGAEHCMLLTDLANPTSNKIYASIGYVRFADWEEHRLCPPASKLRD